MKNAYVYRMRELSTGKWYVGVHSGTNPNYICSSRKVLPLYKADPKNWDRKILRFGDIDDMYELEEIILRKLNAIKNPKSYNANIGGKYFRTEIGSSGHKGKHHSDAIRNQISSSMTGNTNIKKGTKFTDEHRANMSVSASLRTKIRIQTPDGIFASAKLASIHYNVSSTTIRTWCKSKSNFSYIFDES